MFRIELAGCTGSGKTTLARELRRAFARRGVAARTPIELVFGVRLSEGLGSDSIRNVVLTVALAPLTGVFCWQNRDLTALIFSHLLGDPIAPDRFVARCFGIAGKMSTHVLLQLVGSRRGVVILDEGVLHAAHNVLVYSPSGVDPKHVERYARSVPLNDRIVLLSAEPDEMVARALQRPDPPMRFGTGEEWRSFIVRVLGMFEMLVRQPRIQERAVHCHAPGGVADVQRLAEELAEGICAVNGEAVFHEPEVSGKHIPS